MSFKKDRHRFPLLSHFSLISFVAILVVAVLILAFYRYIVINTITDLGEAIDMSVAKTALNSIEDDLSIYLDRQKQQLAANQKSSLPSEQLASSIERLVDGLGVVRIKIYARDGTVVYSTNRSQIGRNQIDNAGFSRAIKGGVASKLIYNDRFNPFDKETSDDNLIQTYLPVNDRASRRPIGVFEIYSDANSLVRDAERSQLIVIPVVVGILLVLYLSLVTTVRRANILIEQQERVIADRTQTLEILSAKLLNAQEDERKRIATTLHEGVAQSLMAIKFGLENQPVGDGTDSPVPLLPLIQDTIDQTRELAMDLRPSTLDDFGAINALTGFFSELSTSHSNLSLKWEFKITEQELPRPLKTIVFRIAQDTLRSLIKETEADEIKVTLSAAGGSVSLTIAENGHSYHSSDEENTPDLTQNVSIIPMRERTILSGGAFNMERDSNGSTTNVAVWPI